MTVLILGASFYIGRLGAGVVASARLAGQAKTAEGGKEPGADGKELGVQDYGEPDADDCGEPDLENEGKPGAEATVVVDAGHGGVDAGKVGVNNALEKEINLAIARKLEALLAKEGVTAVLTRQDDGGLYDEGEPNKKQQDMKRRCALIEETKPLAVVSIHQNSYTDPSVKGPQVFFYENSAEGRKLASILQDSLNTALQIERPRECKGNESYYLLRKTSSPAVIAECGFLSNPDEAEKLASDDYQDKVAEALCAGILEYIRQEPA